MIKVSIIVPVYNVEKYLEKCLNSLTNQTLQEIEIITVNDGSKDKSLDILMEYSNKYPNKIKVITQENQGLSGARNTGIKVAKGEFIGFVDSDDFVEKEMYEKMYNKAKKENLDIIVCATNLVYENKTTKKVSARFHLREVEIDYLLSPPMACNKLFKRELFDKEYQFKLKTFYEDLELIPTFILKTNKIGFMEESFYQYFQRNGSIMYQTKFQPKILDIFAVLESIEKRFDNENKKEQYKQELEYLNIEHLLYSSAFRLAPFPKEGTETFKKIKNWMDLKYPNWRKNTYYKKKSKKFKLICNLTYLNQRKWIVLLNKIKKKG